MKANDGGKSAGKVEEQIVVRLLKADPHQFGPGKVHLLDGDDRTVCGQKLKYCPGTIIEADAGKATCNSCRRTAESRSDYAARTEQYRREAEEREAQREKEAAQWWAWYDAYLQTPEWRHKRELVLTRAGGKCEGCGQARATEVHHLTYARVGHEMLFDLVAICSRCHSAITSTRSANEILP